MTDHSGQVGCIGGNTISSTSGEIHCSEQEEWKQSVGCKQRKQVSLDIEWSQKDYAAFSPVHGHQVGMVMTRQRLKKVILCTWTNRKKGSKLKAGYKNTKKFLKTKALGSTKLTVNATQCHDGPRTLWLPKLENAIYQILNGITFFSINSRL